MPSAYQSRVLADGAVAYWPLDDAVGSGTAHDLTAGARTGTITGGVTLGVAGVTATNPAMAFNGTTGTITFPAIPSIAGAHSVEAWALFAPAPTGTQVGTILSRRGFATGCFSMQLDFTTPGACRLSMNYPAIGNCQSDPLVAVTAQWNQYVATYDGTSVRLYISGGVGSVTARAITDTSTGNTVVTGFNPDTPNQIAITLQDLAIYPTALTPTVISQHYTLRLAPDLTGNTHPWWVYV